MRDSWKLKGDKVIWILVLLFAMVSVVAVFSSSSFLAAKGGVTRVDIFFQQIKSVLLGFIALFVCYLIPLKFYRSTSFTIFALTVLGLILLFIPGFQDVKNGAVRGIKIFGRTIQVFEFVKIGIILYLAKALEIWDNTLWNFKHYFYKILIPIGAVCVLILPNSVSSALLIGLVSLLILFFMDVSWKNLGLTAAIVLGLLGAMVGTYHAFFEGKPDRLESSVGKVFNRFGVAETRILNFFNEKEEIDLDALPKAEAEVIKDENRQSENAKIAIYEGGIFGKGPGKSTMRYSLSMAFSDFIYAFIIEEYGLVLGGIGVLTLYLIFLFRCIRLCRRCRQTYTSALTVGLSFLIICQALLHILVNVRLLPITGHTLPLISHGGTAYLVMGAAFGMILSVSKQLDKQDAQKLAEQQAAEAEAMEEKIEKEIED